MLDEHAESSLFVNCIDAIKIDLTCGHDVREALALGTLGNIGSPSLAKDLGMCVISKALVSAYCHSYAVTNNSTIKKNGSKVFKSY